MFLLLLFAALLFVLFAVRLVHGSIVRAELEGLASDCLHVRSMVGDNAEALEFVSLAEAAHASATTRFEARQLRATQTTIANAYVHLRNARRLVQPDLPEEEDD